MKGLSAALTVTVLALASFLSAWGAEVAVSTQNLSVNGIRADGCQKYNIDGSNYFKLRDLAALLNGTGSQFSVSWDDETQTVSITTGETYELIGGEGEAGPDYSASAQPSAQTVLIDGALRSGLGAWNIGDNNYFKLRDLAPYLFFAVDYDEESRTVLVYSAGPEALVTVYDLQGNSREITRRQLPDALAEGWLEEEPVTLYGSDGRTVRVPTESAAAYLEAGWYADRSEATRTMYRLPGGDAEPERLEVWLDEIPARQQEGWMLYPDYVISQADSLLGQSGYAAALAYLEEEIKNPGDACYAGGKCDDEGALESKRTALIRAWYNMIASPMAIEGFSVSSVVRNGEKVPVVYIRTRNLTGLKATRVDLYWVCIDAEGHPTSDSSSYAGGSYHGWTNEGFTFEPGEARTISFLMQDNKKTVTITDCQITAVTYEDGRMWQMTRQ